MTTTEQAAPAEEATKPKRGPREFKENPTPRDRVIGESLAKKVKELTKRDVSLLDVLAVKFALSRWYEDPATKELMNNMDDQLKKAKAQEKAEKARKLLEEAEKELGEVEADADSDDTSDADTAAAAAAGDDDGFDDDGTVDAEF